MTAAQVVTHLEARHTGAGRWMAKCPAHRDKSPSLSIAEGREGVLLHCFSGCSVSAILDAAELRFADLFGGPPPSPAQMAKVQAAREERSKQRLAHREAERRLRDRASRLEAVRNALGKRLARTADDAPEGTEMSRLFHLACDRHREARTQLEEHFEKVCHD